MINFSHIFTEISNILIYVNILVLIVVRDDDVVEYSDFVLVGLIYVIFVFQTIAPGFVFLRVLKVKIVDYFRKRKVVPKGLGERKTVENTIPIEVKQDKIRRNNSLKDEE